MTGTNSAGRDRQRTKFHEAMAQIYIRAKKEAHYNATYFLGMLAELGGYETALRLIRAPQPSDGYTALYERGRLDLTVEALVLQPEWQGLFDESDIELARERLQAYGYASG
jgi:hypothetical protein